ncbi:hypothetical protein HU200_050323 [Digitaria exilis]|uniref:Uncharacterized protein n=1 Tax=Digitaria exilis TaxID=1010633 RepID=A0A835EBF1_9POAL|nr:hypothetical protein HU200_050323 [Digitaria exilis]
MLPFLLLAQIIVGVKCQRAAGPITSACQPGRTHGGGSPKWREEIRLRISQEAEGVLQSPPLCFRRFDGFSNQDHPSIFRRRQRTSDVAAAAATSPLPQLPGSSSNLTITSAKELATQVGSSGGGGEARPQIQGTTGRDIVVAAVGPYHHHHLLSDSAPPLITRAKKCAIVMFLVGRFGLDDADFLDWVRSNQDRARRCYERDSFVMSAEALAEMLLLDACLLLFAVFLVRTSVRVDHRPAELAKESNDKGKVSIYLSADISLHMKPTRLDLLMLDNQIPFFVLSELHRRLKGTLFPDINHSIEELALSCFDDIHPSCFRTPQGAGFPLVVHHLLHLFHWSRVPRGRHMVGVSSIVPKEPEPHLPSATELVKESLTRFSEAHREGCSSLDISFRRKTLGMCGVYSWPYGPRPMGQPIARAFGPTRAQPSTTPFVPVPARPDGSAGPGPRPRHCVPARPGTTEAGPWHAAHLAHPPTRLPPTSLFPSSRSSSLLVAGGTLGCPSLLLLATPGHRRILPAMNIFPPPAASPDGRRARPPPHGLRLSSIPVVYRADGWHDTSGHCRAIVPPRHGQEAGVPCVDYGCGTAAQHDTKTLSCRTVPGHVVPVPHRARAMSGWAAHMAIYSGVVSIPALCIHNYSDSVFRSLIAFEQNHLRCGLGVTAYSICMARLLQSEADVKNDKEVVEFFGGLRDEYGDTCMPDDLLDLCKDVEAHQQSRAGRVVKGIGRQCFPRQTVTFFVIVGAIVSIATLPSKS